MAAFDLVVIGSGPGGYVAAIRGAQLGMNVAIVEKDKCLGGTCLNVGCIPSKALLKTSEHYWMADKHFVEHGINIAKLSIDIKRMIDRKNEVVKKMTDGIDFLMKKNKITVFKGTGSIQSATQVLVGSEVIETKNIIIATGSYANPLRGVAFDGDRIVSSTEALEFSEVPKELLVIGAGVIGLEMGSIWARLGAKVTIVEYGESCLPGFDKQIQKTIQKSLEKLGVTFVFNTGVTGGSVKNKKVQLSAKDNAEKETSFSGDYCLVAIGRGPYTANLGLEKVGIEIDKRGFIPVSENFETKVSGVFAIGDVIGGLMLAHKAEEEGVACSEIIAGHHAHMNYNTIPGVVYTFPEIAVVGKTEEQLKEEGIAFNVGKFNFSANGRAVASAEGEGFVKVLADKNTDRILGVHMIGPNVSELIAETVIAMEYFASSEDIGISTHAHPTLSEAVKEAMLSATKRSIHGA